MEIIAHLLREQDPKTLAIAQTSSEKATILAELELDAQKEKMENKLKLGYEPYITGDCGWKWPTKRVA